MTNIQHEVWRIIEKDPNIQLGLQRDLINIRALARYIAKQLDEKNIEASEDSIISAIRRYPKENAFKDRLEHAREIVSQSTLTTRSHIANIALAKGKEAINVLREIFLLVNLERGETLRIVQGEESIKILIDEKNADKIVRIIPKSIILNVQKDLAEINMHLHPEAVKTPGIVLVLTTELMLNNIIMYEIMSCVPEMLIFVKENDLLRAYQVLFELCHPKKNAKG